jgi:CheY-like chemotaxis protein
MHPATEKTTVLVVDDEAAVRAVVRTTLLRQGYEVLEAEDGVAAY